MLRQATNKVRIEGYLSEINLKYGSYQKNGQTVNNINGDIKVLVPQVINGEEHNITIPVYMFASQYTNAGKPNPAYTSIEDVMKNFISIAASGSMETADKIRITNAEVRMNEYYNAQDQLISFPRIRASFVNKAIGEFRPEASFSLEFAVSSMDYVTDSEGVEVEPKKLRIKVIVPQYGGKVDCMELFATNPVAIDAITTYWENGKTYSAKGRLNFETTTREVVEECDFGEPDIKVYTSTISELLITKGTQSALDDDMGFSQADLASALKERKARLEEQKERGKNKATPAPAHSSAQAAFDLGF